MKKLKSLIACMSVGLLLVNALPASADANYQVVEANKIFAENGIRTVPTDSTYQELSDAYGLKDVSIEDIPANTEVIKFDSEEELATMLESLNSEITREEYQLPKSPVQTFSTATITKKKAVTNIGSFGYVNIEADFLLSGSGSFIQIDDVKNIRTYASGFVYPFTWVQTGLPYSKITTNKQSATAYGSGVIEYYALIQGFVKVYSQPVNCSVTYSIIR